MLQEIVQIARPFTLFNVFLLYALGVGMARYSGEILDWEVVTLGILWLTALYFGSVFLLAYFQSQSPSSPSETEKTSSFHLAPNSKIIIAYAFLAVLASLSVLFVRISNNPNVYLFMVLLVFGALSYPLPRMKINNSGFGELLLAILNANLTPAMGYLMAGGNSLHLLALITFPLTALYLAMLLVFSLSTYASDLKYSRCTMIIRMGWQNGMLVHNLLICCAYLLLLSAMTISLPWHIGSPALYSLPIGIFQIWNINRIAEGGKPNWRLLTLISGALFCITAYLLTFSFWIR